MNRIIDILMSDSKKAYAEMQEENKPTNYVARDNANYVWVLDFNDGNVYRYDISALCNEQNGWNPDSESCEAFLYGAGHKVNDCEWMVTTTKHIETDSPKA
jgi:hypothetical protein